MGDESLEEPEREQADGVRWSVNDYGDDLGVAAERRQRLEELLAGSDLDFSEVVSVLEQALGVEPWQPPTRRLVDGPFSAPAVNGPSLPPAALVAAVPHLVEVLETPDPPLPARRDWSWRADESQEGGEGAWTAVDAELLAGVWTDDADATVRGLIDRWAWAWPELAHSAVTGHHPDVARALWSVGNDHPEHPRARDAFARRWVATALSVGLHEHYRQVVDWPDPVALDCAVCGRTFAPEVLSGWMRRYGRPRYCEACCCRARNGHDAPVTANVAAQAVQAVTDHLGFIPPQNVAAQADLLGLPDDDHRDVAMAALVALPTADRLVDGLGVEGGRGRWLRVLQAVGVVGDAWRTGRGTLCFAADGHPCRSLAERSVDDWMANHGVEHVVEPPWPTHPELNPKGRLRADWRLTDGTLVELAGMMDDEDYAQRMAAKAELAEVAGIRLVVITPDDLGRLGELLP